MQQLLQHFFVWLRQFWEYIDGRSGIAVREEDPFAQPWWLKEQLE